VVVGAGSASFLVDGPGIWLEPVWSAAAV